MSTIFDNDVLIHIIAAPGLAGDGFTAPEAATLRSDIDTLLGRPIVTELNDVPDVDTTGATDGQALLYNAGTDEWKPGASGGTIRRIAEAWGDSTMVEHVSTLRPLHGISVEAGDPGTAYLKLEFGGTGSAVSAARSDHHHNLHADQAFPFDASGTLSAGTRTLVTGNVSGLDPARTYIIKGTLYVHMRGDGTGASYTRPRATIAGNAKDIFEDSRVVAGVLITEVTPHTGVSVTGVTNVAVSASVSYQPGDPAYIGGGVLVIEIESNR